MAVPSPTEAPQTPQTGPAPENPEGSSATKERFAKAMGMAILNMGFKNMSDFKEQLDELQKDE